jgi:hypothetical protein
MLILELLLLILYGIWFCLFMYNFEITNKLDVVGAFLWIIFVILQLFIYLIWRF